ncbi:hypothetical protein OH146_08115 [Salinibacterium sp. SYSU T00001]|uniref:hypothetical protein n=1 Tax=Homoserinimonas sedimenticola TaxID=2986805 RepID=UPI002235D21C|nr:hypothetical protein [Salinibacterium sedimenticola]MCW4385739.1 hypothetical protein [Salinibacterium sedimenticola]
METTITASTYTAWVDALDALERELDWAEDLARARSDSWMPPVGLGVLPAELVERATRILTAQRDLMRQLEDERREAGRHLAALRSVPSTLSAEASVYLDVAG